MFSRSRRAHRALSLSAAVAALSIGCFSFALAAQATQGAPAAASASDHSNHGAPATTGEPAPRPFSLYDHGLQITGSDGKRVSLSSMKGHPVLITMFFATCPGICPLMTEQIMDMENRLSADERNRLRVVFVSFDEADTNERLIRYATEHGVDPKRWLIGKGTPAVNQHLADMLGIRFEKLPNGSFNHTAMVDLLDRDGVIVAKIPATSLEDSRFSALVKALTQQDS